MMRLPSPTATRALGFALGKQLYTGDVVALAGPLGAGKTVLAKGIIAGLGYDGDVPSPSFPLVIAYDPPAVRLPVVHVDLYRIDDPAAIDELGLDEARGIGAVVVEWPERFGRRGWPDMLVLTLALASADARDLTATVPPAWERRWPPQ